MELWSSRKLQVTFSSHPKVLATLMGPVESSRTWSSLASIRNLYGGMYCLYTESFRVPFYNTNRNILVFNVNNTASENRSQPIRKPPNILVEWNSKPEIFSFSQALEISGQYLLLRTDILQKKVAGCPRINTIRWVVYPSPRHSPVIHVQVSGWPILTAVN